MKLLFYLLVLSFVSIFSFALEYTVSVSTPSNSGPQTKESKFNTEKDPQFNHIEIPGSHFSCKTNAYLFPDVEAIAAKIAHKKTKSSSRKMYNMGLECKEEGSSRSFVAHGACFEPVSFTPFAVMLTLSETPPPQSTIKTWEYEITIGCPTLKK